MREIKFRVWDKKTKKMRQLVNIVFNAGFGVEPNDNTIKLIWVKGKDIIEDKDIQIQREDNFELMQYTGLHDESGKEIYEGDIVRFKHRDITIMAPVKYGEWQESKCDEYDCPHYGYYIDYKWDNYCENTGFDLYEKIVEVVGNIYENPELLKGADNIE